jgi:hypothetical protein
MRQIGLHTPWIYPEEPPELKEIYLRYGELEKIKRGVSIQDGGEYTKRYYIKNGLATHALFVNDRNWMPVLAIPGRAISDIDGFTQELPNMSTYVIRNSELYSLTDDVWEKYVLNDSYLFRLFSHYMILKLWSITEGMIANYTLKVEDRFRAFLKSLLFNYNTFEKGWNKIPVALSNKEYASFVGSTSATISRFFALWKDAGFIRKSKSYDIYIHSALFEDLFDWVDEEYGPDYRYKITSKFLKKP